MPQTMIIPVIGSITKLVLATPPHQPLPSRRIVHEVVLIPKARVISILPFCPTLCHNPFNQRVASIADMSILGALSVVRRLKVM